jgi:3-methyladenine DNA glycosylase/8-oxoguanine DNA glycosylase
MKIVLSARPPFSLSAVVHSHGWIQLAPFLDNPQKIGFSYILELDSGKVVEIQASETKDGVLFEINASLNETEQAELTAKLDWMLGLDQDFTEFYSLAKKEPRLEKAVNTYRGRILRSATLFEDIVKTILTTNTLWAATRRMTNNLVSQYGAALDVESERRAFPTPKRIANVNVADLRSQTRLGYRAPYIGELSQQAALGNLDLESLKKSQISTLELRKKLLSIKGIGPYASANLLMLLGHYDFIPVDSWALKMVSQEWHAGQPISAREVETAFEPWGKWKGLAYWLWDWSHKN